MRLGSAGAPNAAAYAPGAPLTALSNAIGHPFASSPAAAADSDDDPDADPISDDDDGKGATMSKPIASDLFGPGLATASPTAAAALGATDTFAASQGQWAARLIRNASTNYGSLKMWAHQVRWNSQRNMHEAKTLAAAIDAVLREFKHAETSETVDILMRRLQGVQLADHHNNEWALAESIAYSGSGSSLLSRADMRAALKDAAALKRLTDGLNSTGKGKHHPGSKAAAGGGSGDKTSRWNNAGAGSDGGAVGGRHAGGGGGGSGSGGGAGRAPFNGSYSSGSGGAAPTKKQ